MNNQDFSQLLSSIREAGNIHRGDSNPSRIFEFDPVSVQLIRKDIGLSQNEFADLIHISKKTLQNWEQGRRKPQGPALALLLALKNDSKHVISALNGSCEAARDGR